jgi:hypothetical protein
MQGKRDLSFAAFWIGYFAAVVYVARYIYINFIR